MTSHRCNNSCKYLRGTQFFLDFSCMYFFLLFTQCGMQNLCKNFMVPKTFSINCTFFFISNPTFQLSLELLSEVPEMRLTVAIKLVRFFDDYRLIITKFGKIEQSCPEFPIWGSAVADQVAMIFENVMLGRSLTLFPMQGVVIMPPLVEMLFSIIPMQCQNENSKLEKFGWLPPGRLNNPWWMGVGVGPKIRFYSAKMFRK